MPFSSNQPTTLPVPIVGSIWIAHDGVSMTRYQVRRVEMDHRPNFTRVSIGYENDPGDIHLSLLLPRFLQFHVPLIENIVVVTENTARLTS